MNTCITAKIIDEIRQWNANKNKLFTMRVYTDYGVYETIENATVEMFEQNRKNKIACQLFLRTDSEKRNIVAEYFDGRTCLTLVDDWDIKEER